MAKEVRAIDSHSAAKFGDAAELKAIRESGVHDPVALAERT
jgi:hypothetical protein